MSNELLLIETLSLNANKQLGRITLNAPKALNALTLDMVNSIHQQLLQWYKDPQIAAVLIDSSSEKAFCAGGDVRAIRNNMLQCKGEDFEQAEAFFVSEYALNYLMHRYNKPIVAWGNGIVMGGGWGLFAAASHRVVTPDSRLAMPEISIGLYPDVGGSYFLNQQSRGLARFLGLTGAIVSSASAIDLHFATHCVEHTQQQRWLESLTDYSWSGNNDYSNAELNNSLAAVSCDADSTAIYSSPIHLYRDEIEACCNNTALGVALDDLLAMPSHSEDSSGWLQHAQDNLRYGSMLSARLIDEQLSRMRHQPLDMVFLSEMQLTANILRHRELAEGVRALLLDKDRKPPWPYATLSDITDTPVSYTNLR
ncbi:enoyl-CoA hydratase/isomerase family protein, partial [bacterium]|nr:enoyl-CoA hydratase/isomerase family protein [bacterium]